MNMSEESSAVAAFRQQVKENIQGLGNDEALRTASHQWSEASNRHNYTYNFTWMSRPIIQYPQDIVGMQEIIWETRPDLIIETGIAHGGSLIFSASMLALLDMSEAIEAGTNFNPAKSNRKVVGVDIDIRSHNRVAIEAHPMASRITMLQGSSIAPEIIAQVREIASRYARVLVCLDSMHSHAHVMEELKAYAPLTTPGSYCVVFDTLIEDMPEDTFSCRPWGKGDNPKTAVWEFLKTNQDFAIDKALADKLLITVAPDGFLKRLD